MSYSLQMLPIEQIELDKDNPRIKQFLEYYTEITSEMLALALSDSDSGSASTSYRSLKDSIKESGGIIHPIIVSHEENGKYIVIEGNTRVQIYKEFRDNNTKGNWDSIMALVYEQLSTEEKHKIRLQSHLVGPRDWDPYSKAKYLYTLSEIECMNMNAIISMCGGRQSDILRDIETYKYMRKFYEPYAKSKGYEYDTRDYSKFLEYLKKASIKTALKQRGYEDNQFAKWVAEGNIDNAQKVRLLPAIMRNDEAHKVFLTQNLSAAEKIIHAAELSNADLSEYPYDVLARELYVKMMNISVTEVQNLATNPDYADKRDTLNQLRDKLDFVIDLIDKQDI